VIGKSQDDFQAIARQVALFADQDGQATLIDRLVASHLEPVREPESGFVRPAVRRLRRDGLSLFVAPGQVLVRAEHASAARDLLDGRFAGPEPVTCGDASLPISRFRTTAGDDALADAIDELYAAGIAANFSHVTPSGPYIKGSGGPEYPHGEPPHYEKSRPDCDDDRAVRVAVIDTGINVTETDWHTSWLRGIEIEPTNTDPLRAVRGDNFLDSGAGHGTFVAGIIRQIAPNARVEVLRALDSDGLGSEEAVACAILRAAEHADIINLSLGTETYKDRPPVALEAALELIPEHIVVIAAAGNDGSERPNWPAAFKRVTAVAGLDSDLQPTKWSNHGSWVNVSTQGEGIVSTYVVGTEANDPDADGPETFEGPHPWALWTGTSFAAPQIAGLLARDGKVGELQQALADLVAKGTHLAGWGSVVPCQMAYSHA
jgi:Subtilase family